MSIGICFDDDYSDNFITMSESADYYKLRTVIRKTYNANRRMAESMIKEADEMTDDTLGTHFNAVGIRSQALGMMESNINLMRFLIEMGFENDADLIKEETE